MTKTPSNMLPLGTKAPKFSLTDVVSGKTVKLDDISSKCATVIMFICNHCPYVKHINLALTSFAKDYQRKNVDIIAINAHDIENYPDDSPENMKKAAIDNHYTFAYLFDETQEVAKAYQAACTPDFYVFDNNLSLVYRGQFDDSRPGNSIPVTGASIRSALDCLLSNSAIPLLQKPSLGCNIKWKEV